MNILSTLITLKNTSAACIILKMKVHVALIILCLNNGLGFSRVKLALGFQATIPVHSSHHNLIASSAGLAAKANKNDQKRSDKNSGGDGFGMNEKSRIKADDDSTHDDDSDEFIGFTRYFENEGKKLPFHKRKRLVQISSTPLIFTMDDFVDAESCSRAETSESVQLSFRQKVADVLFKGQTSLLDGLRFNSASSSDPNNNSSAEVTFPDGIHMDTNNDCIFRHATAILYLNNVPVECGGATIFPLARALESDPALLASRRLLEEKISHTRSCGLVRRNGIRREVDAKLLETRVGSNYFENPCTQTAIRVQPKVGRLLLFFSRTSDGMDDPRCWHGGERLRNSVDNISGEILVTEKRILTLFKQVDYGSDYPAMSASTFEAFLAPQILEQRAFLESCV